MRRLCAVVMTLAISFPSVATASEFTKSFATAVAREVAADSQTSIPDDKNRLLIPGLSVMGAGALIFLYGLVHETGVECSVNVERLSTNCGTSHSKAVIFTGVAAIGAGGFLIWKGDRDRKSRPELVPMLGGAAIRQRFRW